MDRKIRWAHAVSHLCNPAYLAVLLLLIIGIANPRLVKDSSFWACLILLGFIPALIGQDSFVLHRYSLKTRRKVAFIVSSICYISAYAICLVKRADNLMLAISASYLTTIIILLLVNLFFKASGHGGAVSGPVLVFNIIFPGWGLLSLPLLVLVAWARLASREHTLTQILTGMAIGLLSTAGAFLIISPHCF